MTHAFTATICVPGPRHDLPAYARTGQLHSGDPWQETAARCIDLLHAVHSADHDEHEDFNLFLEEDGHPAMTGTLTGTQARRISEMAHRYHAKGDPDTANCAELLLNAAGLLLERFTTALAIPQRRLP